MRLELLKEIPDNADLRQQWNDLALRAQQPQVFYTYQWALAVYRAYYATLRPLLFLAYDEQNSLCGLAALAADSGRRVSFLGATTGDYCDFLSSSDRREEFVGRVLVELRKQNIGEIGLANLPADSETVAAIGKIGERHGYHVFARTGYICAQVSLGALERRGGDKPVLPRKKMLRRFLNAMGRENPARLDHARTWDALAPVLPQFMQAHVARFLVTGRISNMARPERRLFLTELAKLLSEAGWLVLTRMMAGDKVYAWNYGFQFQGTWFWYQPTFDSDQEKYSPGFCLLAKVVEDAVENAAFKTLDLGLGAEDYKDRFANQTRETLFVTLKTSALGHYREIIRYRASAALKSSHEMERRVRSLLQKLQSAKEYFVARGATAAAVALGLRLRNFVWARTEVFFYEWDSSIFPRCSDVHLESMNLQDLARAATEYVDDEETLAYLLRSAQRLRREKAQGFALVDQAGKPLHFAWLTGFDGFFLSELNTKVKASSDGDVMLFDCWTPVALRGRRYYAQAIELISSQARTAGHRPWIFSAATNVSSVRGLAKAGFQKRYSLYRNKVFGWQTVSGQPPAAHELRAEEVSARI